MAEAEKTPSPEFSLEERVQQIRHVLRHGTWSEMVEAARSISLVPRRREKAPGIHEPGFDQLFYHEWGEEYCLHDDLMLEAAYAFLHKGCYEEAALQLANLAPSTYRENPEAIEYATQGNPRDTSLVLAKTVVISQRSVSPKLPE